MNNLKFTSLNVRRLNNGLKRRKVFHYLKRLGGDVFLLQETHCNKSKEHIWQSEWGNKCIFSNGDSNSCGVAMLFSKKLSNKISEIRRDLHGRVLQCKLDINEYSYGITNLYAPNQDNKEFFQSLFQQVGEMDCVYNIIAGDFNVVRYAKMDRSADIIYHKKSKKVIDNYIAENNMLDIWRLQHPDKEFFTHMRLKEKVSWSRIDYFLVSQSLQARCKKSDIIPSVCTDHSAVNIELSTSENPRGPGT